MSITTEQITTSQQRAHGVAVMGGKRTNGVDLAAVRAARRRKAEGRPVGAVAVLLMRVEALEAALRDQPDRTHGVEFQFDRVLRSAKKLDRIVRGLSPE